MTMRNEDYEDMVDDELIKGGLWLKMLKRRKKNLENRIKLYWQNEKDSKQDMLKRKMLKNF